MASLQKIAIFLFFDSVEQDLIQNVRNLAGSEDLDLLNLQEREKARDNLSRRDQICNYDDDLELLAGLDIGEKFGVLMRQKDRMDDQSRNYFTKVKKHFDQCISVRNSVMHGRPLTIDDYAKAFALTNELMKSHVYWPKLSSIHRRYSKNPQSIAETAIQYLDSFDFSETYHNLPIPDYEDTGFFPRPKLERELKKKILGRHPVVTVLGDGGDGKTAVTLQTLYGLLHSNDHDFDAIIWVSAKSSKLTGREVERIETQITSSLAVFGEVAGIFEDEVEDPLSRVLSLMEENKILLVIDNLETIIDKTIKKFAENIPGESKLVLTSRIPLGSDLSVNVEAFSESEAVAFLRVLVSTYGISVLKSEKNEKLRHYASRLHRKPLLLKWFSLGVLSGLNPSSIVGNPEKALKFCLENVFDSLSPQAKNHLTALSCLPRAASLAVIEHVTEDDVQKLEASLAELMRFAIVEQLPDGQFETSYQIKPLAKAYLVRVLKSSAKNSSDILKRFRQIDGIYQNERGAKLHNRYNPNHYTVRSKSEALAVKKLKSAIYFARHDDYLEAFSIIDKLKVSHPDYFEVNRVEAYISSLSGDNVRAQDSYLLAIETGEKEPQLHLLYGGFLLRTFGDHEGALAEFKTALELDKGATTAYIEASRASLYLFDFEGSQKYITKALAIENTDQKTQCILCDLQVQIYWRSIDHRIREGDLKGLKSMIRDLTIFLSGIGGGRVDPVLIRHLQKYILALPTLRGKLPSEYQDELDGLEKQLEALLNWAGLSYNKEDKTFTNDATTRVGSLKQAGRQATYGFLVDLEGEESFVHKDETSEEIWNEMLEGSKVRYEVIIDSEGRERAQAIFPAG